MGNSPPLVLIVEKNGFFQRFGIVYNQLAGSYTYIDGSRAMDLMGVVQVQAMTIQYIS